MANSPKTHPNKWKPYQNAEGMLTMNEYNSRPIRKPAGKVWFLNGDIVRVYHQNRGAGIITLYNVIQDKLQTILVDEWIKKRMPAYSVTATGALVNRHPKYLSYLAKNGQIPKPIGSSKGGVRALRVRSYYSEDTVYEIRDILASRAWGRTRYDGLRTNNRTPTLQELKRRMGVGILQYTRTEEGKIIPIWGETVD